VRSAIPSADGDRHLRGDDAPIYEVMYGWELLTHDHQALFGGARGETRGVITLYLKHY
jgi:hypothetical protein